MTNAEKYKEVFGFDPDMNSCPTYLCSNCPLCKEIDHKCICGFNTRMWWMDDYKGNDTVKVEVTEVHTFAKPEDTSGLKFGD